MFCNLCSPLRCHYNRLTDSLFRHYIIYIAVFASDAVWSSEQDGFRASPIMPGEWRRGDVTSGAANATLSGVVPAAAAGVGTGSAGVAGVGLSPEFVNYLLALAFYNVRYAAVFWHAKALFSLLFSLQLFVASLHFVLAYCGMAVLYKLRLNARLFATTTTTTTALPAGAVMTLYLAAAAVVFMSPIAVFNYGHAHYERAYRKMAGQARGWRGRAAGAVGCHGYAPHCVAAAALVALVALRAPLVYDCVAVYRATGHALLLAVTVVDAVYMLCWIGTWTALTVKQTWAFHVDQSAVVTRHAPAVARGNGHVTRRSDALSPATSSLRKSTERRHHATSPRVTFTDAMGAPPGGEEESGGRERGRDEGVVRRAGARAAAKPRPLSDSSLDQGQPRCWLDWAATPDNTLTRDYRHSIRHKCDEYYRHSVEGASPPAAHSSPVTMRRQRQLMLPPMVHSAPAAVGLDGYARQHGLSPIEAAADGLPPYATVRRRRPPAESTPEIADAKRHNRTLSGFYGAPAKPRRSFATQNVRAQATMLATTAPGHAAPDAGPARPGILRLAPVSPPAGKPPRPRAAPSILKSGGVTRKPELYRRDSALPSSNETSSNDSSDVLCSQV